MTLPGAFPVYMPITKPQDRTEGWKNMWAVLQQTLAAGEQALVHCMAGRHRAAAMSILACAVLTRETISESEAWIRARRSIEHSKIWVERMRQETRVGPSWPLPVGYVTTVRSKIHLRMMNDAPLCSHKQARSGAGRLRDPIPCDTWEEASAWGRTLCHLCQVRAPAGWRRSE